MDGKRIQFITLGLIIVLISLVISQQIKINELSETIELIDGNVDELKEDSEVIKAKLDNIESYQ
jgi:hypothetical protein